MAKQAVTDHTWDEAILLVLQDAGESLHYAEISKRILERKLKTGIGANPAASVAATLSKATSIENPIFQKVGRGIYTLRPDLIIDSQIPDSPIEDDGQDTETGALRAFGMFWSRDSVVWSGKTRLLGRQASNSASVDFSEHDVTP